MKKLVATLALLSVCAQQAVAHAHGHRAAQGDLSGVEIKAAKVAGNVYMLTGAGGNIGVIAGPEGVLIVDDQFAPLAQKIRAALRQINSGRLRFVLNTHWHYDHTGGNAAFSEEAALVAHTNVRKRLASGGVVLGTNIPPSPREDLPIITYDSVVYFHFGGEDIRVAHFPNGHTDGDSVIFFNGSNVIHMGDQFFAGAFPFVDLESGGSVEGLMRNIAEVIRHAQAGVKIIPGHGPVSTVEDLKTYHAAISETREIIRARIRDGKTLEQAKAEGLPEKWRPWGAGFIKTDQWIETVYRSLKQSEGKKVSSAPASHTRKFAATAADFDLDSLLK